MPIFFRKKDKNRQVFGFLRDNALALRVKMLAGATEVPIREHLLNHHLLVDKLGEEEYEQRLIAKHAELGPEEEKLGKALIDLVKRSEDKGIPHGLAIEIIEELVIRLERRRKVQQMQQELRRQMELETLRQINKRSPGLIPALLKLMAKYPAEDLERTLSPIRR